MKCTNAPEATASAPAAAPVSRARRRLPVRLCVEVVVALVVSLIALLVCIQLALHTETGQRLDEAAMYQVSGPRGLLWRLHIMLTTISVPTVALALLGCEALALARRRWAVALAVPVLMGGANATTQILKHEVLTRTDFGMGVVNALPSGHTTVMLSLSLAAVLVVPGILRGLVSLLGAAAATLVGVGTVVLKWHRPSEAIAATAVCAAWAAIAVLIVALLSRRPAAARAPRRGAGGLALLGAILAGVGLVAAGLRPVPGMSSSLVLVAGSLGAIGLACALAVGWTAQVAARSVR